MYAGVGYRLCTVQPNQPWILGGCINEYTVFDVNNDNRRDLPRFQPEAMRANTRIVNALQASVVRQAWPRHRWLLAGCFRKHRGSYRFRGTTKLSHLEENLRTSTSTSALGLERTGGYRGCYSCCGRPVQCGTATSGRPMGESVNKVV